MLSKGLYLILINHKISAFLSSSLSFHGNLINIRQVLVLTFLLLLCRLEPVIIELERQRAPVVVVAHQVI
jgi:hypothetical protein